MLESPDHNFKNVFFSFSDRGKGENTKQKSYNHKNKKLTRDKELEAPAKAPTLRRDQLSLKPRKNFLVSQIQSQAKVNSQSNIIGKNILLNMPKNMSKSFFEVANIQRRLQLQQ